MSDTEKRVVVVSVGGSEQPIIHSLNIQRPEYIIYFTSAGSRRVVRQLIEPALEYRPEDHEVITTEDEQNLVVSVEVLLQRIPVLLKQWGVSFECVTGDYTGGTKTMSSALVLVLAGKGCPYSYIGGSARDKEGLGVVVNGSEQMFHLENPWDVLAVDVLREIRLLFNRCRFRAVQDLAERTAKRVERKRTFFQALRDISEGLYLWDNFQYSPALNLLLQGDRLLRPFVEGASSEGLRRFSSEVRDGIESLERIKCDALLFKSNLKKKEAELVVLADGQTTIADLLSNAVRRAEIEYKYDDAVARLYSAIEKTAKIRLKVEYGLDNSDINPELLPEGLRESYQSEISGDKIQLPLHRSFSLLADLGDPLGVAYQKVELDLRDVLSVRNMSLLAHGFEPVKEKTYRNLLAIALDFMQLTTADLPRFPQLNWDDELL